MKSIFTERRQRLGANLPPNAAIVIAGASTQYRNADSSYAFRQDSNFWYLTGFNEAEATLVVFDGQFQDRQINCFCSRER